MLVHPTSWFLQTICKYNFAVIGSIGGFYQLGFHDNIVCSMFIIYFVLSDKNLNRLINIDSPPPPLLVLLDFITII